MKKPHLYKRHKLYHCRYKDKLTVGSTPKQAYSAMRWLMQRRLIMDDTLI